MNISNRGDTTRIELESGHFVEYDAPRLRRQAGNDQARMLADIIARAIASQNSIPVKPAIPANWVEASKPWTMPTVALEELPSGLSQDDED